MNSKAKFLKQTGITFTLIGLVFWIFFLLIPETGAEDLISIKGEFVASRQVQIVKQSAAGPNLSTVISLTNYPDHEFNLGETFEYSRLQKEIEQAEEPIMVELHIPQHFFEPERAILPAFYGFWINGKEIKSNEQGFKTNKRNLIIVMIVALFFSLIGAGFLYSARHKSE